MNGDQQLLQILVVSGVMLGFALAEWARGLLFPKEASKGDLKLDIAMALLLPVISGLVLTASMALCERYMPAQRGAWGDWAWWQMLLVLLVADDLTQYLWHRLSHTSAMWPLHRAHHSAAYMSVRVVYRNNIFYYAMMPGIWLSGVLLFMGFGWVYVAYSALKVSVIIGAHSSVRWDQFLYQRPALRPLAWVLERTISTPATHFAHHALVQGDGVGHYSGNYGNLLFVWDILFGTAHLSRRYPAAYGLQDDRQHGQEHWLTQISYPLRKSARPGTVLGTGPHGPPA